MARPTDYSSLFWDADVAPAGTEYRTLSSPHEQYVPNSVARLPSHLARSTLFLSRHNTVHFHTIWMYAYALRKYHCQILWKILHTNICMYECCTIYIIDYWFFFYWRTNPSIIELMITPTPIINRIHVDDTKCWYDREA